MVHQSSPVKILTNLIYKHKSKAGAVLMGRWAGKGSWKKKWHLPFLYVFSSFNWMFWGPWCQILGLRKLLKSFPFSYIGKQPIQWTGWVAQLITLQLELFRNFGVTVEATVPRHNKSMFLRTGRLVGLCTCSVAPPGKQPCARVRSPRWSQPCPFCYLLLCNKRLQNEKLQKLNF